MDGVEVLRRLRQWDQIPILVVSARDQEKQKVEALDLGANDYITKPFGSSELLARIRLPCASALPLFLPVQSAPNSIPLVG